MSSTARTWVVAGSIATVEALKDRGLNYPFRCLVQHVNSSIRSNYSQANNNSSRVLSSNSSGVLLNKLSREEVLEKSEESMMSVIYLNSWGPN
ncbi:hypothetical protein RND81_12G205700 [Saponaria officinalis]|uniref:Wound-responsive family protein n=1 Tax=Saponaria officinalis TaxID=3572 RepID=A0AAW1HDA9_SAPOF